jgi:SulP family sulfate permease
MMHAVTLLFITLAFGRWASLIPMATLAAILVVVSYHMSEWRTFLSELRTPKSDVAVLLVTFGLTVFVDLTVAMGVGMVLAAFLFIRRMAEVSSIRVVTHALEEGVDPYSTDLKGVDSYAIPRGVEVYEINGPFFFGAAETFTDTLGEIAATPAVLILRMRHVLAIDATGMRALQSVVHRFRQRGTTIILSDVEAQPLAALTKSEVLAEVGKENVVGDIDAALTRARGILDA